MKTAALFVAAVMASATPLFAQMQTPWSVPQWTPSRDPLPTWSVPQLPSIGLPLPPIGPAPVQPRVGEHHPRRQWNPVMFYMLAWPPPMPAPPRIAEPVPAEAPAKGSIILRVQPGSAQVWVDGYYAGSADDFSGSPRTLALDAGPHTIEFRGEDRFERAHHLSASVNACEHRSAGADPFDVDAGVPHSGMLFGERAAEGCWPTGDL